MKTVTRVGAARTGGIVYCPQGDSRWTAATAGIVAALVLAACGGGSEVAPGKTEAAALAAAASSPSTPPSTPELRGTFLYRYDQYVEQVTAARVQPSGATTDIASVAVRAHVSELAVDQVHRRVYALLNNFPGEQGHPDPVVIFAIQADGSLRQQGTAKLGPWPYTLAVNASGTFAYSMSPLSVGAPDENGQISQFNGQLVETFAINADGTLTSVAKSAPIRVDDFGYIGSGLFAFTSDGKRLFAASSSPGVLIAYSIGADGSLVEEGRAALNGNDPYGTFIVGLPNAMAVNPGGDHVYVADLSNGQSFYRAFSLLRTFAVSTDGSLVEDTDWVNNKVDSFAASIAVTPDGKHLYDAGSSAVDEFSIRTDGTLSPLASFVPGASPGSLALDPDGTFVFVSNLVDGTLNSYAVEADGSLAQIGVPRYTDRSSLILRAVKF